MGGGYRDVLEGWSCGLCVGRGWGLKGAKVGVIAVSVVGGVWV